MTDPTHGPDEFSTGGLYQDDPRDYPIAALYDERGLAAATVFPTSWKATGMPPVLNQGSTPQCVAFSGANVKNHQDRLDQGQFFNFDEARFFSEIGGTANGAYISTALSRLKAYGYPVASSGDEQHHKITAYYAVPKTANDLKSALMNFGPLWCIGQWWHSWFHPLAGGVLPAPDYKVSGHATVLYGWNSVGMIFRNSWGSSFGASGDFVVPWSRLFDGTVPGYLWAAYKTVDVIEYSAKAMACGAQIRPDAHFGASLGTIAAGTKIGVSGAVPGSTWTKTSACNPGVANSGTKWYVVRTIGGVAVGVRFPGRPAVYVYAGAVKGG